VRVDPAPTPTPARVERPLDFVVIGAAKSGTTTLFHHLRRHPDLYLPPAKEAPFFSKDDVYQRGWAAYLSDHFAGAPPEALWGTVTPRYLGDLHVPERMFAAMPDVKLLALLRDPVERALSKYRLLVRQGRETRTFERLVDDQLEPAALHRARTDRRPLGETLVVRGEYARLLGTYLEWFPRDQLLVHLTTEYEDDPQAVLDSILTFLGRSPGWTPDNLDERYYVGGDQQRLPGVVRTARRSRVLRRVWRAVPTARRQSLALWFNRQFNVRREDPPPLPAAIEERLAAFYAPDGERLASLLGRPVPWAR
jgi:hypothetical protein